MNKTNTTDKNAMPVDALNIGIHYGAMADSIAKQLRSQKAPYFPAAVSNFQKIAESIVRLRLSGMLTEKEAKICYNRLTSMIIAHVYEELKKAAKKNKS